MAEPFRTFTDIPVRGGALTVAGAGPSLGSGAPVVLAIHGITGSHRGWAPIVRALGDDVTVLAPDLRGRGGSNALPEPYGIDTHIADLVAVLDHVGTEPIVVTGHSMGAYIAARLAAHTPDRVKSLVLIDGAPALPLPPGMDPDAVLEAVLGPALARLSMTFESLEAYHEFWRSHPAFGPDGSWTEDTVAYFDYDLGPAAADGARRSRVKEAAVRADGRDLLDAEASRAALAALKCPATLLWAPRNLIDEPKPMLPAAAIEDALQLAPSLEAVEVPDTNHYLMVFRPRESALSADAIRRAL